MNLVIFAVNQLGDNVTFVPVVQAIRRTCPDWYVTLITGPIAAELYQGPLGPHKVIVCERSRFLKLYRRPWRLAAWIFQIRRLSADACLVGYDQGNCAHLLAKLSGAKVRIGGKLTQIKVRNSLTETIAIPDQPSPASWSWAIALSLFRAFDRGADLPLTPPAPDLTHLLPTGQSPLSPRFRIAIHPGSSRAENRWGVENFSELARRLMRDCDVTWLRHSRDEAPADPKIPVTTVSSLSDLATQLKQSDLFIGNNSGPMHVASALGVPGVVVTGQSARGWDPFWHRPDWTVLRHPSLACAPCEEINRPMVSCVNLASPMACLTYWTPDRVEIACRVAISRIRRAVP